jgi:hypothetical protein
VSLSDTTLDWASFTISFSPAALGLDPDHISMRCRIAVYRHLQCQFHTPEEPHSVAGPLNEVTSLLDPHVVISGNINRTVKEALHAHFI